MQASLTLRSENRKTGGIPVSYTSRASCSLTCPLRDDGCYAEGGKVALHWKRVTEHRRGVPWDQFVAQVACLIAPRALWRHNIAGDLPGDGTTIDRTALQQLVTANQGKRGFTYTHYAMTPANRAAVKAANDGGFTINLSADNLAEADELAGLGVAPVVVLLPSSSTGAVTPAGRTVKVCPAVVDERFTCMSCGLCQKRNRSTIIGFPAHGQFKAKAHHHTTGAS